MALKHVKDQHELHGILNVHIYKDARVLVSVKRLKNSDFDF